MFCPVFASLQIDGVDSLNNILLIGMTNRMDMIDEALLRPGRLELKLMIGKATRLAIATTIIIIIKKGWVGCVCVS